MKTDTVNLIERPYQEVVDDILTAIVGGIVNEPIIFDVKKQDYPLSQPASDVRAISGTANGLHHTFYKEIDYLFSAGDNTVVWEDSGTRPDDETIFYVDYFKTESRSPLTDINIGSITRTLSEAIGREITTVYQQINRAYLSGFIDTAEGTSLDMVVAILGITRKSKDYAVGLVTFFRDTSVKGDITIAEGTVVTTDEGDVGFETTQPRVLQRGQVRIDVPVRAADAFKGDKGEVEASKIVAMAQMIAGIERVNNYEPTVLGDESESDEELRLRAKAALRAFGKATIAAITLQILEQRAELIEIWDPNSPPAKRENPGNLTLLVGTEPERLPSLQAAVEQTRAAGIRSTIVARYVYLKPRVEVEISTNVPADGKDSIVNDIITAVQDYVDGLGSGDPADGKEIIAAISSVEDVKKVSIVDVMTWRTDISQPGAESLAASIVNALSEQQATDNVLKQQIITQVLTEQAPSMAPSGQRIQDRGLVQSTDNMQATDEQIESGEFTVIAKVNGEDWWLALDMDASDILLVEQES